MSECESDVSRLSFLESSSALFTCGCYADTPDHPEIARSGSLLKADAEVSTSLHCGSRQDTNLTSEPRKVLTCVQTCRRSIFSWVVFGWKFNVAYQSSKGISLTSLLSATCRLF